jgi:uncharacterized protein YbaR (Trm112 family)
MATVCVGCHRGPAWQPVTRGRARIESRFTTGSERIRMSSERACPDCGEPLERMELQGTDITGTLAIVSPAADDRLFAGVRADEVLTPVPYVCPECRRTLVYAEE